MIKIATLTAAVCITTTLAQPASASPVATGNAHNDAQFVNKLMTATYLCRNAIGISHYQAARVVGMSVLVKHTDRTSAHSLIAAHERTLKADPRTRSPAVNATACFELINNIYFDHGY